MIETVRDDPGDAVGSVGGSVEHARTGNQTILQMDSVIGKYTCDAAPFLIG
jgi:hypothetical protein